MAEDPPDPPADGTEIFPDSVSRPWLRRFTCEPVTGEVDTGVPKSGSMLPDCASAGVWKANSAAPAIRAEATLMRAAAVPRTVQEGGE
ncbi:hypothetical protein AB0B28_12450 [Glycomyces sp. NPDC046736]|uniref:hypothetical protein n=1 Tax=Glycomyces sp. NPDC046736 TaxID=3155615 RepID=UPI0033F561AB